jgi:PPOX class probable F420-dependent enzyme
MTDELKGRARELVKAPNFAHVVTQRPDGTPHSVVVWADAENGTVTLNSAEGRIWPELARQNPEVTITVPNHENPYEYVVIRGRVEDATTEGADEHIDALSHKYLGKDYPYRAPGEQRLKFTVRPEEVTLRGG